MNTVVKEIIPNKSWILEDQGIKIGTLHKEKNGFSFFKNGVKIDLRSITDVKKIFGNEIISDLRIPKKKTKSESGSYKIYDFPCNAKPVNPVYNIRKKIPIFSKTKKSKCLFCAGYYIIKLRKGWEQCFCPKLITVERYEYIGPFKTQEEMNTTFAGLNQ